MNSFTQFLTGTFQNPTIGLIQCLYAIVVSDSEEQINRLSVMWIYMFAPLIGGVLASLWQKLDKKAQLAADEAKYDAGDLHSGINY